VVFLEAEFGPCFTFCDARVDVLFYDGGPDPTGGFDFLAVVVETVGYDCLCTILVCGNLLWGKGGGILEFFVVSPILAANTTALVEP